MASTYTGNPIATQSPSPAPSVGSNGAGDPVGNLPTDGDALNASSVAQALKVPLDWTAFFRRDLAKLYGVRVWDSSTTFAIDALVIDDDHLTYKAITSSTNKKPASNPSDWAVWGFTTATLLAANQAAYWGTTVIDTDTGIASTGGTLVAGRTLLTKVGYGSWTKSARLCFAIQYTTDVTDTISLSGDKVFATSGSGHIGLKNIQVSAADGASATAGILNDNAITLTVSDVVTSAWVFVALEGMAP